MFCLHAKCKIMKTTYDILNEERECWAEIKNQLYLSAIFQPEPWYCDQDSSPYAYQLSHPPKWILAIKSKTRSSISYINHWSYIQKFFTPKHEFCENHNSRVQHDQLIQNKNKKTKPQFAETVHHTNFNKKFMKLDHREEIASFNLTNSETIQYPKEREREILENSEKLNMTYDLDRHERHLLLDDTCLRLITAFFLRLFKKI